jgi:succinoglycan biosynthesis protein ExoA
MSVRTDKPEVLVVIPTLDEAVHIGGLLDRILSFADRRDATIVVADGGSTDGTCAIVAEIASRSGRVHLLHNPDRVQSAGINRAVSAHGAEADYLIRIDAHATYPKDYCDVLIEEAAATGADSVVVGMVAEGRGILQAAIAAAQNSRLGNGGSAHRREPEGAWVDHGHHALMRLSAFRAAGGYDESFRHNEDAELDRRLVDSGHRIWLTPRTLVTYHPRTTLRALARQYVNFGVGRAQNLLKHGAMPKARQAAVLSVGPALALVLLAPLSPLFALPAVAWLLSCLTGGAAIALRAGRVRLVLSGVAAATMHAAWSLGFWRALIAPPRRLRRPALR